MVASPQHGVHQQMLLKGFFWANSLSVNGLKKNKKEVLISSPSTKQLPWCAVIHPLWIYCALLELNFLFLPFSEIHIQ